jgi:hypothetical protein
MATPTTSKPPSSWTGSVADTVESVVLTVKDKTTVPLQTVARGLVYGLVLAVVAAIGLVLTVIAVVRVADVWLLGWAGRVNGHHRLYIAYLALGMVCSLGGFVCWSRRAPKESRT